jgi:hypothetical protein
MSVEAIRAPSSPRRTSTAYMAAVGCSVAGSAAGFLGATGTTNAAGNPGNGAVYTGIYVSAVLLTSALVIPYAPMLSHRLGARSLFIKCKAVTAVVGLPLGSYSLLEFQVCHFFWCCHQFLGRYRVWGRWSRPL